MDLALAQILECAEEGTLGTQADDQRLVPAYHLPDFLLSSWVAQVPFRSSHRVTMVEIQCPATSQSVRVGDRHDARRAEQFAELILAWMEPLAEPACTTATLTQHENLGRDQRVLEHACIFNWIYRIIRTRFVSHWPLMLPLARSL